MNSRSDVRLAGIVAIAILIFVSCSRIFNVEGIWMMGSANQRECNQVNFNSDVVASICTRNPFLVSVNESELEMIGRYNNLVKATAWDRDQITLDPQTNHDHNRFRVFHKAVNCKVLCGIETLRAPCVV